MHLHSWIMPSKFKAPMSLVDDKTSPHRSLIRLGVYSEIVGHWRVSHFICTAEIYISDCNYFTVKGSGFRACGKGSHKMSLILTSMCTHWWYWWWCCLQWLLFQLCFQLQQLCIMASSLSSCNPVPIQQWNLIYLLYICQI